MSVYQNIDREVTLSMVVKTIAFLRWPAKYRDINSMHSINEQVVRYRVAVKS